MFDGQQKATLQSMQVKFSQYLYELKDLLTLPEYHCVKDLCLGILKSRSLICMQIATSLHEKVSVKKVCERFTRHLNKAFFGEQIQSLVFKRQCRDFDQDTAIIVDDSDLVKSSATCMEGLKRVRDGSTGEYHKLGYDLLNIVSYQDSGQGYELRPLCSDLISRDLEADSMCQLTEDRLTEINLASGNRGVYVFDRGYDNRQMFSYLRLTGMNYILRSVGDRGLITGGVEKSFLQTAKSVPLSHLYRLQDNGKLVRGGLKRVSIRLNPHPVKYPETMETWLVVARYEAQDNRGKGFFYLFCDFPGQPDLTGEEIIAKALRMYRMRWKIEELHRHFKQAYGWEKLQLISYTRLKNMNQVFLLTMCWLYSLKRYAYAYLQAFPSIMHKRPKDWKKIFDFAYYRLSELLETCLSHVTIYDTGPFNGLCAERQQLIIPCLENGGM